MSPSVRLRAAGAWAVLVIVSAVGSACGGGDGEDGRALSKAEWEARYGETIEDVAASLDAARAALQAGEPVGIRTSCGALRDTEAEARRALPVPDEPADAALRQALTAVAAGTADCLQAVASSDARRLERSIAQLRDARGEMDRATQALRTWP